MENIFYVYGLIDPRTQRTFYIGKGSGDRSDHHVKEAKRDKQYWVNPIKCQIINNIIAQGHEVVVSSIEEGLHETEAFALEESLIIKYGKLIDGSGQLSNIADGGSGGSGSTGKSVVKYTASGAVLSSYKTLTEAARDVGIHKSTLCAALNGRTEMAGGFVWSYIGGEFVPPKTKGTPIVQYDLEGNKIKTFNTIKQAAEEVGVVQSALVDLCRHKSNAVAIKGYRWSYVGEQLSPIINVRPPTRKLIGVCVETNQTVEFETIVEATNHTPANTTGISDCAAGRKKSSGGFRWSWVTF